MLTDLDLLRIWGPWFLMAYMVLRELLPFLRDKLFPQVLEDHKEESERRWTLNERQVQALENIGTGMQQTAVLLATIDARDEVIAAGMQRIEVIATEINTRSRGWEPIPVSMPKEKEKVRNQR